jgi:hypothetical protein
MTEYKALGKRKAYIFTFDRDIFADYKIFHDRLGALNEIENWFHYIKSSYLLISKSSASELTAKISKIVPSKRFLILEVNLKNRNGFLPDKVWEWIRKYAQELDEINPNLLR